MLIILEKCMFYDQLHYYINNLSYKVIFNIPYLISVLKQ